MVNVKADAMFYKIACGVTATVGASGFENYISQRIDDDGSLFTSFEVWPIVGFPHPSKYKHNPSLSGIKHPGVCVHY